MNHDLLRACKFPLALLALVIITGLTALHHAEAGRNEAQTTLTRIQREEAASRAAQAREAAERTELAALEQRLQTLQEAGIVGEEKRLDWVDALNDIRRRRGLFKVDYEIGPQQSADPALVGPASPEWSWRMSPMRIQLTALHEGDVLNLLRDLREQSRPWLHVEHCNLQRAASPRPQGPAAQLTAECQLQWISARPPEAKSTEAKK